MSVAPFVAHQGACSFSPLVHVPVVYFFFAPSLLFLSYSFLSRYVLLLHTRYRLNYRLKPIYLARFHRHSLLLFPARLLRIWPP